MKERSGLQETSGAGADLRRRIEESLAAATRTEAAIAGFFLSDLSSLPFETAGSVARRIGVSEASVGRYCRAIGFRHFKDLKASLRSDLGDRAFLIGDRLRDFAERSRAGESRALEKEIAAIVANHELAATPAFRSVTVRLARTKKVFIAGFQTERGHAAYLAHGLSYLRPGVQLMDAADGTFADLLLDAPSEAALVIVDGRRYSRLARHLGIAARAAGAHVTLITDPYCTWGREAADELFIVRTDFDHFWDATSAMASLTGLMVNAVFAELGPEVETRLSAVSALYGDFIGHTAAGGPERPGGRPSASRRSLPG
ncbi:RpiR family transcriptional regulator [Pleomorphomonas diazotrophica]|uniref:RpiR family transcriptional regulator n=1 Tax=Pleomorphomonas diazotrophica TaxID=1166257 RepID=A0A1I4T0H8_9HYPH|nr:MurR/RpiR family transcriptional regulator [Pleomorphomonas diazotrophica]PKR88655.1 RpiR family transcriptional regulator [Pleomorphomonas diazotrophica]SFM70159.1 DNA-binding transcriptional regulator, MurR/RpiR family, contains HTH and SIS domains [Pleomorphomonas diazotrophica]